MGLNLMFWNCQGARPKRKELELYLKENEFDIVALNETFLTKKTNFKIHGYDMIKSDRSTGRGGGVAFLVKHGLVVNKEYRNTDFNIITDNEALVIDIDLSNNQNLTLATIYCPNGNPNLRLFETINDSMQKPPRPTLIRRNSLLKASKDTSASRVTILIQNTSTRSISLSRIIMNIFILLKTPMITDRTWTMIMIWWLTLTLILSLS